MSSAAAARRIERSMFSRSPRSVSPLALALVLLHLLELGELDVAGAKHLRDRARRQRLGALVDGVEALGVPEDVEEGLGLAVGAADVAPLVDDDGPAHDREAEQEQHDQLLAQAGVADGGPESVVAAHGAGASAAPCARTALDNSQRLHGVSRYHKSLFLQTRWRTAVTSIAQSAVHVDKAARSRVPSRPNVHGRRRQRAKTMERVGDHRISWTFARACATRVTALRLSDEQVRDLVKEVEKDRTNAAELANVDCATSPTRRSSWSVSCSPGSCAASCRPSSPRRSPRTAGPEHAARLTRSASPTPMSNEAAARVAQAATPEAARAQAATAPCRSKRCAGRSSCSAPRMCPAPIFKTERAAPPQGRDGHPASNSWASTRKAAGGAGLKSPKLVERALR